jgi:hypothetical protein
MSACAKHSRRPCSTLYGVSASVGTRPAGPVAENTMPPRDPDEDEENEDEEEEDRDDEPPVVREPDED